MSSAAQRQDVLELTPEENLIGRMLKREPDCLLALRACRPALFKDPFHRTVFEAIERARANSEPTTVAHLTTVLGHDPSWPAAPHDHLDVLRMASSNLESIPAIVQQLRAAAAQGAEGRTAYPLRTIDTLGTSIWHDYLIKGLMAPGEMSVIYGEPGSGKSFLASWFAYLVALEMEIFGRRVRGCPTIYVALEGQIGFERRLRALRDTFGAADQFYWITQPADLYGGVGDAEGLVDAVLGSGAQLLVIDTLARAMGAGSENEGRDMGQVIAAVDFIRRETGAHVAIVHHSGKDSAKGMRGHSSLLGAADMAMEIKRSESGARSMRIVKAKDGLDGEEFGFSLDVVDLGTDEDGDTITTCIVTPGEIASTSTQRQVTGAAKVALALLDKALDEAGELAPVTPHIPSKSRTIRLSGWEKYCDAGLVADDAKPDSKRKAFVRATRKLQELGLIGVWSEFAWRK